MKERGINQGHIFGGERTAQSLGSSHSDWIQQFSPPVDAAPVSSTIHDEEPSYSTVIFSSSMLSVPASLDSIHTSSQPEQEAPFEGRQEPASPDIATAEPAGSLDIAKQSRETNATVSPENVPVLTSREQYVSELWRIQRLEPETEETIVAQARNGDQGAKNALIESCLVYVMFIAKRYHVYVEHDDLMDLVGVVNLAITEKVDQALERATGRVTFYLGGVAKRAISNYCLYRSRLIPITTHSDPISAAPHVESLDVLLTKEEYEDLPIQIAEAGKPPIPIIHTDQTVHIIRQALATLTDVQRQAVEMRHGLHDTPSLSMRHIAEHLNIPLKAAQKRYERAIKLLRRYFSIPETKTG